GDGVIVIAGGGGGVPVVERGPRLIGKEGVVDKDLAASILAHEVQADVLLILTDVERVQRGFGSLMPESIDRMDGPGAAERPKRVAPLRFVQHAGRRAVIAELDQAREALAGEAGTEVVPTSDARDVPGS